MVSFWTRLPDGTAVHIHGARPRRKPCVNCRELADRECDWCDRPICIVCSTRRGDVDACPEHKYELQEREAIQLADSQVIQMQAPASYS